MMAAVNVLNSPPAHAYCVLGSGSDSELPKYSGAPSVLIREELAVHLQLPIWSLPEPYKLGNTWGVGENESMKYVKLRVALPDHSWSSITCHTIVVPSLCASVILGKVFLESDQLIEDHSGCSLICKPSNRDLLAPLPPSPTCQSSSLHDKKQQRLKERIQADDARRMEHLRFLRELRCTTAVRRIHADRHTIDVLTCAATLVRDRVEQLAFQETLVREDATMKAEFVDLFPEDIPHINHLPSDV
ncbi:hypothetical protein K466DRAFT_570675 [Polyporus arcularius HHB13444]|uniref:Uncharacterized protein n=1 Tax=Polyporus arcularius HHB13444 TaxID=1314778 RepID=A0A5C3NLU4_9APHY|nr:hypothetical protein K466DRAFT_570675 [Polyporus arcularius HHB13444]